MNLDDPECAVCYQPIREYDWYIHVRRAANPIHVQLAHHACPPSERDQ